MPPVTGVHLDRTLRVDPVPVSVRTARRFVTALLDVRGCGCSLGADAELMVSELVTNAVRYQRERPIVISALLRGPALRVDVTDDSDGTPVLRAPVGAGGTGGAGGSCTGQSFGAGAASGRGLLLVQQLATRWGWTPLATGKVVWFEAVCICRGAGAPGTFPGE